MPSINDEGIPLFYTEVGTEEPKRLGGNDLILVDNPHNINIHTELLGDIEITDVLKFMCNNGYKNYTKSDGTTEATWSSSGVKNCVPIGGLVSTITLNGFTIYAYKGNNSEIFYLTNKSNINKCIAKPKKEYIDKFFDSLDNFQKILMNRDSNPKYTTLFEVISENSFGYITEMKPFTFPTTYGGHNLAMGNAAYNSYLNSLMKYATFYDEYFSDNIWRSMTHESIKNFDWTYTREYGVGEEEGYIYGGTRIQKTLRLIGREFDEIKTYIDALKNYQKVDYGKGNAIPDYFLTDAVSLEGWDVENIYPYDSTFKQVQKLNEVIKPYSTDYICADQKNGYFYKCDSCNNGKPKLISALSVAKKSGDKIISIPNEIYDKCFNGVRYKVKQYSSEKEYSLTEINNHFMKMLKLNSKAIFRKKGTIQGIESLLAIFGLRSKRWCDEYKKRHNQPKGDHEIHKEDCFQEYKEDYEIKEYVAVVDKAIPDKWLSGRNMNEIDWYNSTKTVSYDTEDYRNGIYYSYQGLPVRSYINEDGKYYMTDRLPVDNNGNPINIDGRPKALYPYFSPYKLIDGNPYYQMNGGWLNRKPKIFDRENNIIEGDLRCDKETYRNIRTVKNLKEMINIPRPSLKNNDLCYVEYVGGEYVLIDGILYDIKTDEKGKYISTYILNNTAKVGSKFFASELTVSDVNGLMKYVFSEYKQNTEIRIYVYNNTMTIYGKYYAVNNVSFILNGNYSSTYKENQPLSDIKFYQLKHINNKAEIGGQGWNQVPKNTPLFKRINSVIDKFKGNNPHTGHMNYDNGKEYLSYFSQLFKHALEDNQFNERCYNGDYFKEVETIRLFGFTNLGENTDDCNYPEYLDSKIHYFGNKKAKNGTNTKETMINAYTNDGFNSISNILDGNDISDQIINIKRVDINFIGDKSEVIIKYLDNVVMNYLEQILPSTLIINVNYCS